MFKVKTIWPIIGLIWGLGLQAQVTDEERTALRLDRIGDIVGEAVVVDGDTLIVDGQRIRLHGIDAPESGQRCLVPGGYIECGREATMDLANLIGHEPVWCKQMDVDRYDRIVAVCESDDFRPLNETMVHRGWALAYREYSLDYIENEEHAKLHAEGMWKGQFVEPWNWRRGQRLAGDEVAEAEESSITRAEGNALNWYDDNENGRISCAEARSHGITPVKRGDPAYPYMSDRDGDGIICE